MDSKELVVIKVGSNTLTDQNCIDWLALDEHSFRRIGSQALELVHAGIDVAIVSSAAVVAGYAYTHEESTKENRSNDRQRQIMSCLGQRMLINEWDKAIVGRNVGQLLFTNQDLRGDTADEIAEVSQWLMARGDIIVANENDAVSHQEISFGDNDILAARYTALLREKGDYNKSSLILLSDVHGVYNNMEEKKVISQIDDIDLFQHVAGKAGRYGTGGMKSKFKAARIATSAGVDMYVTYGRASNTIQRTLDREIGTQFSGN